MHLNIWTILEAVKFSCCWQRTRPLMVYPAEKHTKSELKSSQTGHQFDLHSHQISI